MKKNIFTTRQPQRERIVLKHFQTLAVAGSFLMSGFFLAAPAVSAETVSITRENQKDIQLAIYQSGLVYVSEVRSVQLPAGEQDVQVLNVPKTLRPETVLVHSSEGNSGLQVIEQNFDFNLFDPSRLLDQFIGREIKLLDYNQFQGKKEWMTAKLLNSNNGQPVYEMDGQIYIGYIGTQVLPEIPKGFTSKPALTWKATNATKKEQEITLTYLAESLFWTTDYSLILNNEEDEADLVAWVSVQNTSGVDFENAGLTLVAGEPHRDMQQPQLFQEAAMKLARYDSVAAGGPSSSAPFASGALSEYYVYSLQRRTDLKENQKKQIKLMEAAAIPVEKEYLVYGDQNSYTYYYQPGDYKKNVMTTLKFKNDKESNLGEPLPQGTVHIYKKIEEEKQVWLGEDHLNHTPKEEKIEVAIGEAFDLKAERRQMDYVQVSDRIHESTWQIKIRNQKAEDVKVGIVEPVSGQWQVISHSHEFEKVDAQQLRFDVEVPEGKEAVVEYRIRVKY